MAQQGLCCQAPFPRPQLRSTGLRAGRLGRWACQGSSPQHQKAGAEIPLSPRPLGRFKAFGEVRDGEWKESGTLADGCLQHAMAAAHTVGSSEPQDKLVLVPAAQICRLATLSAAWTLTFALQSWPLCTQGISAGEGG